MSKCTSWRLPWVTATVFAPRPITLSTTPSLAEAWDEIAQSDAIRVAVLYSDLPDIFCSGMDLKSVIPILTGMRRPESEDEKVLAQNPVRAYAAMLRGRTWDKPIVSAVHGLCLTGGFEMVMGSDLRIASEDAEFWMREASFGIMPIFVSADAREGVKAFKEKRKADFKGR